jgi:hypothetical protein
MYISAQNDDNTPRASIAPVFAQPSPSYTAAGVGRGDAKLYAHTMSAEQHPGSLKAYQAPLDRPFAGYVPGSARGAYLARAKPHTLFAATDFIAPGSTSRFIGDAAEIAEDIKEAFRATTGEELPADIQITVLNDKEFVKAHLDFDSHSHDGVLGFSLNSNGRGVSQVFVRAMPLDKLMLTVGHEIGHVLTPTLANAHDEEAKAFAFSLAWMEAIKHYNIAGIGANIIPEPAHNGLHDIAFGFVQQLVRAGATAWQAFQHLANNAVTITRQIETVEVSS